MKICHMSLHIIYQSKLASFLKLQAFRKTALYLLPKAENVGGYKSWCIFSRQTKAIIYRCNIHSQDLEEL